MKVMFCMLKTMGDVVVSTAITREMKRRNPEWEIHFYTNKAYGPLLAGNPDIAEIHAADDWNYNILFLEMSAKNFGRVFTPYQMRAECNMWHQDPETRGQHLVDFYWNRCGMHGQIFERECFLFPSEEDVKAAGEHISFDQPRIAMHSTSGVKTKDWPVSNFSALTDELRKAGYAVVQVGGKDDEKIAKAVDLRGKMGLLECAAFISKCAAFVGIDSGLSYIADAMRTPTIVIQGSTDPVTSGPISNRVIHLFAKETGYVDCQTVRCHTVCRHENNCINTVTVGDVMDALEPCVANWRKPIPAGV